MLRRATGIWVLLAVTGCGSFRAFHGEETPADKSIVRPVEPTTASSSPSAPSASSVLTPLPSSSDPQISLAQATSSKPNRGSLYAPSEPVAPPSIVLKEIKGDFPPDPPPKPPVEPPVLEALRCLFDGRHAEALVHLQAYDPETRDLLLRMLPMLPLLAKKGVEKFDSEDVGALTEQIDAIQKSIQPRAPLTISKLCFCDAVRGYLAYQPLPEEHAFLAARGDRPGGELVQLYVGMKNLSSRQEGSQWVTDLECEVEIFDEAGRSRWSYKFRPEDLRLANQSRLSDYYHNFRFYLPSGLGAGNYRLTVRLSDRTQPGSPRDTASTAPLRIVAERRALLQ